MLDLNKPVRLRDGREAGIYATDAGGEYPIHGWFRSVEGNGNRRSASWRLDGAIFGIGNSGYDLVNVPDRVEGGGYYNVYPTFVSQRYSTRQDADACASPTRVAVAKVTLRWNSDGSGIEAVAERVDDAG